MDALQKAVNEALWAAIEECSQVEGHAFQQSRCAPSELVPKYLANGEGAVMCKRRLEALLVRVNRGEELQSLIHEYGIAERLMWGEKPKTEKHGTLDEDDWHGQNSVKGGNP